MINYRILSSCLFAIALLAGCAHEGDELPEIVQVKKVQPFHRVKPGDTVGTIAKKYGMTRAELIKLNELQPPYQLYDGQRLVVNQKVSPSISNEQQYDDVPESEETETTSGALANEPTEEEQASQIGSDDSTIDDLEEDNPEKTVSKQKNVSSDYMWPIANGRNRISEHFGDGDSEGGIIIDASAGTPVKSIADGVVMIAGVPNGDAAAYGVTVVVKHTSKKVMSIYANLKEANVKVKQKITKGAIIGKVGKSGTIAQKPQLYFEINDLSGRGRRAIDPEKFLPK